MISSGLKLSAIPETMVRTSVPLSPSKSKLVCFHFRSFDNRTHTHIHFGKIIKPESASFEAPLIYFFLLCLLLLSLPICLFTDFFVFNFGENGFCFIYLVNPAEIKSEVSEMVAQDNADSIF
jgi:hypothetical protein